MAEKTKKEKIRSVIEKFAEYCAKAMARKGITTEHDHRRFETRIASSGAPTIIVGTSFRR